MPFDEAKVAPCMQPRPGTEGCETYSGRVAVEGGNMLNMRCNLDNSLAKAELLSRWQQKRQGIEA